MYKYIIIGNTYKALAVHSDMLLNEIQDYVRSRSKKISDDSYDMIFRWGMVEFVNPKVMLPSQFIDTCPALIGIHKG